MKKRVKIMVAVALAICTVFSASSLYACGTNDGLSDTVYAFVETNDCELGGRTVLQKHGKETIKIVISAYASGKSYLPGNQKNPGEVKYVEELTADMFVLSAPALKEKRILSVERVDDHTAKLVVAGVAIQTGEGQISGNTEYQKMQIKASAFQNKIADECVTASIAAVVGDPYIYFYTKDSNRKTTAILDIGGLTEDICSRIGKSNISIKYKGNPFTEDYDIEIDRHKVMLKFNRNIDFLYDYTFTVTVDGNDGCAAEGEDMITISVTPEPLV